MKRKFPLVPGDRVQVLGGPTPLMDERYLSYLYAQGQSGIVAAIEGRIVLVRFDGMRMSDPALRYDYRQLKLIEEPPPAGKMFLFWSPVPDRVYISDRPDCYICDKGQTRHIELHQYAFPEAFEQVFNPAIMRYEILPQKYTCRYFGWEEETRTLAIGDFPH